MLNICVVENGENVGGSGLFLYSVHSLTRGPFYTLCASFWALQRRLKPSGISLPTPFKWFSFTGLLCVHRANLSKRRISTPLLERFSFCPSYDELSEEYSEGSFSHLFLICFYSGYCFSLLYLLVLCLTIFSGPRKGFSFPRLLC